MVNDTLKIYYTRLRKATKLKASDALIAAREHLEAKTPIFKLPAPKFYKIGAPFGDGLRWVENPEVVGLRFVGYADEIARRNYDFLSNINHTGWFSDDMEYKTLRGVVYQLPARKGKPIYAAGYAEMEGGKPINGDSSAINFSCLHYGKEGGAGNDASYDKTAREVAYYADRIAELQAEKEREWAEVWHKGMTYSELGEDIAKERETALALLKEIRAVNRAGNAFPPAICQALRDKLQAGLDAIRQAKSERQKLLDSVYNWQYAAFNEGAGETVFKTKEA